MPPLRDSALAALAGASVIAFAYAGGRRAGLTTHDLARRIAPQNVVLGRAGQLLVGGMACAPATAAGGPALGAAAGAIAGLASVRGRPAAPPGAVLVAIGAHASGGAVAGLVARRLGERRDRRDRRAQVHADELRR